MKFKQWLAEVDFRTRDPDRRKEREQGAARVGSGLGVSVYKCRHDGRILRKGNRFWCTQCGDEVEPQF